MRYSKPVMHGDRSIALVRAPTGQGEEVGRGPTESGKRSKGHFGVSAVQPKLDSNLNDSSDISVTIPSSSIVIMVSSFAERKQSRSARQPKSFSSTSAIDAATASTGPQAFDHEPRPRIDELELPHRHEAETSSAGSSRPAVSETYDLPPVLELRQSASRGRGLYAVKPIQAGEFARGVLGLATVNLTQAPWYSAHAQPSAFYPLSI